MMAMEIPHQTKQEMVNRARTDPGWWVRKFLGHEPWNKQVDVIESVRDHQVTTVKSCHAAGKSFIAADVVLWFLYTHCPSIVITTAPTDRQVKGILWKEIGKSHMRAPVPLGGELLTQELKLDKDWYAWGFTAPEYDPDRFQGFHEIFILVVVDEASGVSEEIFDAIYGILTTDESRLLLIGNPTNPNGEFAKSFNKPATSKISIPAFISPNFTEFGITEQDIEDDTWEEKVTGPLPAPYLVTPRWVRERYVDWTPESPLYEAKVRANFPQIGDDNLIPIHWIEAAVNRNLTPTYPSELAADIARYGMDETVIMTRAGPVARIHKIIPMCSTMEASGHIIMAIRETAATKAKIDAVGIGAGVYDRVAELGYPAVEMQSGLASSDPERFLNTRAEWWWNLRTWFETNRIDIENNETLISQLASIKYKVNSRGQIVIESKDDMKKRGLRSPDRADTLMLLFADPPPVERDQIIVYSDDDYEISPI